MSTPDTGNSPGESETGRLEAFSDGVLAVIITIMALELKAPVGSGFDGPDGLRERIPALLVYILSFTFVGIYWNNHHHLLRAARRVTPAVMWANLHLLFWLSLIPVLTEWIGEHWKSTTPAAAYGMVCLASAVAFTVLAMVIIRADGRDSPVAAVGGQSIKAQASLVLYASGTALAFVIPWLAYILYAVVAVIWFIPDRALGRAKLLLHTIHGSGIVNRRVLVRGTVEPRTARAGADPGGLAVRQPVRLLQHCKSCRKLGLSEEKIAASRPGGSPTSSTGWSGPCWPGPTPS